MLREAERLERIKTLTELVDLYETKRRNNALRPSEVPKYKQALAELAKWTRIQRGYEDIMFFARTYFSQEPPHNLLDPNIPSPPFHYELAKTLREAIVTPGPQKIAIAAPRGHAKSTIANNILSAWVVCYADDIGERYWLILADKQDNARRFLDIVKAEFEGNELLRNDFGNLVGNVWNALECITSTGVKLHAAGAGEALRGLRFGAYRPSVIADDLESDDSVATPERVEKMIDWFDRTVLPLGDPKRSKFILIGTIISYNSLLNEILTNRPDWKAFRYQALVEFPERGDLWDQWEAIYHDRSEGSNPIEAARIAGEKARAFYLANKEEMDKGAQVLWPERIDLYDLMVIRATKRLSFLSEYQNAPIDEETRVFKQIRFYNPADLEGRELDYFYACDPSMGKSTRADQSAIITVAKDRRTGYIYVVDVDVKRRHPEQIIKDLFAKAVRFRYKDGCVETVAFQSFFADEVVRRSAESGIYLPCKEFKPRNAKKEDRIMAMEPIVSNYVFFLPSQRTLIDQLEMFPKHPRRDAADALAMVLDLIKDRSSKIVYGTLG